MGEEQCWQLALDEHGKLSLAALEQALGRAESEDRPVLMVVSVAGTTELGEVDRIDRIQDLLDRFGAQKGVHIWHHVDGAYGAFFRTLAGASDDGLCLEVWSALAAMARVESVTIDPHKLGYVPYASGAFLTRQRADYLVTSHDAPYIQYRSLHDRGKFTLEGSRSAGGATATWLTAKSIGLDAGGYGLILARTVRIRRRLEAELTAAGLDLRVAPDGDTNVLCFHVAAGGEALSSSNRQTLALYDALGAEQRFFVSKTELHWSDYRAYLQRYAASWQASLDEERLVMIRLCLMNPFFGSNEMDVDFHEALLSSLKAHLTSHARLC